MVGSLFRVARQSARLTILFRSYAELFTTKLFSHMIFVDQAPLQNYLSDWGP